VLYDISCAICTSGKCTKKIVRTKGAADTHGQERERQILGNVGFAVDIALPMSELHEVAERQANHGSDYSPKDDLVWMFCQQPDLPFMSWGDRLTQPADHEPMADGTLGCRVHSQVECQGKEGIRKTIVGSRFSR
jgi:hypothetical protein